MLENTRNIILNTNRQEIVSTDYYTICTNALSLTNEDSKANGSNFWKLKKSQTINSGSFRIQFFIERFAQLRNPDLYLVSSKILGTVFLMYCKISELFTIYKILLQIQFTTKVNVVSIDILHQSCHNKFLIGNEFIINRCMKRVSLTLFLKKHLYYEKTLQLFC